MTSVLSLTKAILNRALIESFGDRERRIRLNGALETLGYENAISFGGHLIGEGDWWRVASSRKGVWYRVFGESCECSDHHYRGKDGVVCAHRELVRARDKASRLLAHVQALEKEGIEVSL